MVGPGDLFDDDEVVRLLSKLLRERPTDVNAFRASAPNRADDTAALVSMRDAGILQFHDGDIGLTAPAELVSRSLLEVFEEQQRAFSRVRRLLEHLPELERAWSEGENRRLRGIEGDVVIGTQEATEHWIAILTAEPPYGAGSAIPSFGSMRTTLAPVLLHFEALIAEGQIDPAPAEPIRFLLNSRELHDPDYRALLDHIVQVGARVRVMPVVPLFLFVQRDRRAVLPLSLSDTTTGGGIFFENSATVESFSALFESWWAEARPYPFATDSWESVLELMAEGLTDKQIASALGIGLRTVHRRIADASDELGAQGRFDLGMAWARRNS